MKNASLSGIKRASSSQLFPAMEVKMEYRRKKGSDTWHWCRNCSNWPTSDYISTDKKPTYGELDNECKTKEDAGTCIK